MIDGNLRENNLIKIINKYMFNFNFSDIYFANRTLLKSESDTRSRPFVHQHSFTTLIVENVSANKLRKFCKTFRLVTSYLKILTYNSMYKVRLGIAIYNIYYLYLNGRSCRQCIRKANHAHVIGVLFERRIFGVHASV